MDTGFRKVHVVRISVMLLLIVAALGFRSSHPLQAASSPADFVIKNPIDKFVLNRLNDEKVEPSPLCSDSEFIRRVYLDVCGIIPSPDETKTFLANSDPQKRAKLIDQLLKNPHFAEHWEVLWGDMLREHVNNKAAEGTDRGSYRAWIRSALASNMPYDQFARELITASGESDDTGAVNFYLRDIGNRVETANTLSYVFMGTRMACAQCHDHPFDKWTQNDFQNLMAFFGRVQVVPDQVATLVRMEKNPQFPAAAKPLFEKYFKEAHEMFDARKLVAEKTKSFKNELAAPGKNLAEAGNAAGGAGGMSGDMGMGMDMAMGGAGGGMAGMELKSVKPKQLIDEADANLSIPDRNKVRNLLQNNAVRRVIEKPTGEYRMPADNDAPKKNKPNGGDIVQPIFPWDTSKKAAGDGSRRKPLADFVTQNRLFAMVQVNRLWGELMGRGIVEPRDDFRPKNPPTHPELLAYLTDELIHSKFDNQHVLRLILNSSAYQRSSLTNASNASDKTLYSHHRLHRMEAEQLFDSIMIASGRINGILELPELAIGAGRKANAAAKPQNLPQKTPPQWGEDLPTPAANGTFMNVFNQPDREQVIVRRDDSGSVTQALEMLNGASVNNTISNSPLCHRLLADKATAQQVVRELYIAALARFPTETELQFTRKMFKLDEAPTQKEIEDLHWALINSREFGFVR